MTTLHLVPDYLRDLYEVHEWRNAAGVISTSCPDEWADVVAVLTGFRLFRSHIMQPGGGKSPISQTLDHALYGRGWVETSFETSILVDGVATDSPTHKVDCYKGRIALEIEWNNKDPFYDRDLNNFRLLFDLRIIDAGIIVTRCDELQALFDDLGKSGMGQASTHISKLLPKIEGGGGGGCPVLVFGISPELYVDDQGEEP